MNLNFGSRRLILIFTIKLQAEEKGYKSVLILEDDAKPITNMMQTYEQVMNELQTLDDQWDLL